MSLTRQSAATASAAVAALALAAAVAAAQPATAPTLLEPQQSVAVNPLSIPFGVFSAEYEAALPAPGFTFGLGGTYWQHGDAHDAWAEAKALYYPNERVFRGFSVGVTAGVHSARDNTASCDFLGACRSGMRTQTAPSLGVLVSYDWLLGRQERFRVGTGIGAKRFLSRVHGSDPLDTQVWPDGRFVLGFVF